MTKNYSSDDPQVETPFETNNSHVGKTRRKSAKTSAASAAAGKPDDVNYMGGAVPKWVREVIEAHLAIENEDARSAGSLGFMARALVIATMPYKDPKTDVFKRINGDFRLRIVAGYEGGIPYGIYPRLLMSWVSTEAVRTQSPVIELGDSLSQFLHDVLEVKRSGGARGTSTRVAEQMKRLFGAIVTAQYTGNLQGARGFLLRNVTVADAVALNEDAFQRSFEGIASEEGEDGAEAGDSAVLWTPQKRDLAGQWKSKLQLSKPFFDECIERPVPIDLRAYKALRGSPLAMDLYTWMTYRMSYTHRATRPIPWEALMGQFGSGYTTTRAVLDFKRAFLKALKAVQVVYPAGKVRVQENGLVLLPSPTHVVAQSSLF